MVIWVLTLLSAVAVTVFSMATHIFLRRRRVLEHAVAPADAPLISIIVPARDEAANIAGCVRSLLAQQYPALEVIAVDDDSSDATPDILARMQAQDARLSVVAGQPLRRGWTGKCNAVDRGVQHARGAWLLFVDADMTLHPGALSAAYAAAQQHGAALVTLWARQRLVSFWERVVQPVIIGCNIASDPLQRVNNPAYPDAATANGQFLLVERAAYEQVGGHTAVRDEVLEDQMLARRFKHAGAHILMLDGSAFLQTRMYTSLRDIWDGWSKNNFLSFNRSIALAIGAALFVFLTAVNPFVMLFATLAALKFNHSLLDPLLINLASIALLLWTRWRVRGFCGTLLRDYLLHGIGGLVFVGIFFNSAYRHLWGRGVTWKKRSYRDVDSVV